jgi:hypothetical protein
MTQLGKKNGKILSELKSVCIFGILKINLYNLHR